MSKAIDDVLAERQRQIDEEGWTAEHDDDHGGGELAAAGASYALHAADTLSASFTPDPDVPGTWPWDDSWWKPKDPRRDLVRAAALILAEIERMDRAEVTPK